MKEASPLSWPDGWPRTRLQDREERKGWKKTERQSIEALEIELKRFGAVAPTLTRKDPTDYTTASEPSVALWFSRKREEDYSWQQALAIDNPAPTLDEINTAFKRVAAKYHPDNLTTGDSATFHAYSEHKKNAIAYVNRMSGKAPDYVIACDKYKKSEWNITAIRMTIHSLRQMERDGTSRLLERAMHGFVAALPQEASSVATSTR
jgi:hypothetical protein